MSNDNVKFTAVAITDIPVLIDMMEDFYSIDAYPFSRDMTEKNLNEFINNEQLGKIWLIDYNNETAGYIVLALSYSFEFKGKNAFIDELYIKEKFRGKGIGKKAVEHALIQAREMGVNAVHLEVELHNERGNRLYEKLGFKQHGRNLMTKYIE